MSHVCRLGNDNTVQIKGLSKATDGSFVSSATVSFTLRTVNAQTTAADGTESVIAAGTAMSGLTGVTMSYVSGSNGVYQGSASYTNLSASVYATGTYQLEITATGSDGTGYWELPVTVIERTS